MVNIRNQQKKTGIYSNYRKVKGRPLLYLVFLLIIICVLIGVRISQKKPGANQDMDDKIGVQVSGPSFEKEGELTFLKPDSSLIVKIDIEIADDELQRQQGLMYRKQMEMSTGMLFVFEDEDIRSFWMKNTYIPLDILYVGASKKIIRIHENTPTLSEQPIPSDFPARYVIEVVAGFTALYNIKTGDLMTFHR